MGERIKYYEVIAEVDCRTENMTVEVVPSSRVIPENLQTQLEDNWKNYKGKKWPNDESPSRFRYEGHEIISGLVKLKVSPSVSYKDYVTWTPDMSAENGELAAPMPLMATSLIETSDGKVIITKRGSKSDYKIGGLSGVGGAINIKEDSQPNGSPDILHALNREIEEETGMTPDETKVKLQAIVYNPVSGTVNMVFLGETALSSGEINKRTHDDENTLLFVNIEPEVIQNLILTNTNSFTTEVLELLISFGEQKFGRRWADETKEIFRLRELSYSRAIKMGANVMKKLEQKDIQKLS